MKPRPNSNKKTENQSPNRNAERRIVNRIILLNVNLHNSFRHTKTKPRLIYDQLLGLIIRYSDSQERERERVPKCVGVSGGYDRFRREKELKTKGERRERIARRRRRKTLESCDGSVGNSGGAGADVPFSLALCAYKKHQLDRITRTISRWKELIIKLEAWHCVIDLLV